jgi:hypothetical protein
MLFAPRIAIYSLGCTKQQKTCHEAVRHGWRTVPLFALQEQYHTHQI